MKTLLAGLAAMLVLGGCVAVPAYYPEPAGYYYSPPPAVHFQYNYRGGGHGHHHGQRHRHR